MKCSNMALNKYRQDFALCRVTACIRLGSTLNITSLCWRNHEKIRRHTKILKARSIGFQYFLPNLFSSYNITHCSSEPTQPRPLVLQQHKVSFTLRRIITNKAAGPHKIWGRVLKLCGSRVPQVLHHLPVPKKWCLVAGTCNHELGEDHLEAHQEHYPNDPGQTPLCLLGEPIQRGRSLTGTAHGPDSPRESRHLGQDAICGFQFSLEYSDPGQADSETPQP